MKNRQPKRKLAAKMMTKQEREWNTPVFDSFAWQDRKRAIKKRLTKKK